jgi:hypothetical protein
VSFLFRGTTWPATDRRLSELRFMRRTGLVHPDDRAAALGMVVDSDGMVHAGPLTIEDVVVVASRLLDDDDGLAAA